MSGSVQQKDDDDDVTSTAEVKTIADVMRQIGLCHGDVSKSCQNHRKSYCRPQHRETLLTDREFDDWPRGVAAALMTSSDHTRSQTRDKRMRSDVMRYLCQLANADPAYCQRRVAPANTETAMTHSDVSDDVRAPAAEKRFPAGDAMAAIMELCGSEAAAGGNRRSACFNRYLKNFARHITTSGNRFVGR